MDTSEQYINMCRKATELQDTWNLESGDYFSADDGIHIVGTGQICRLMFAPNDCQMWDGHKMARFETEPVWLPRIDQWLQMLLDEEINFGSSNYTQCDSVEITCLKLFYSNKYNKSWNGEDWI